MWVSWKMATNIYIFIFTDLIFYLFFPLFIYFSFFFTPPPRPLRREEAGITSSASYQHSFLCRWQIAAIYCLLAIRLLLAVVCIQRNAGKIQIMYSQHGPPPMLQEAHDIIMVYMAMAWMSERSSLYLCPSAEFVFIFTLTFFFYFFFFLQSKVAGTTWFPWQWHCLYHFLWQGADSDH